MNYWIGLLLFSIVSALAASLYESYTFIGGCIMGLCYAAIYAFGKYEGVIK